MSNTIPMRKSKTIYDTTSTPKRRRLGNARILRPNNHDFNNITASFSPINHTTSSIITHPPDRCESPHLPCNQVEYLSESNNSNTSEIPCSPGIINSSVIKDIENWESLVVSSYNVKKQLCNTENSKIDILEEIGEISDDMFHSKLEQSNYENNLSMVEKQLRENIEKSFERVNQTICQTAESKQCNESFMFQTKDSFLLDIKESGLMKPDPKEVDGKALPESFYGLPMIAKGLFKSYRNIEKFYDWQEECLNLDAIKEKRNLIYALPTSGGKTLVAEVLMMREVINRKKNALFILPFVAIVQEKIWSLSPFALQLEFLVEEYAAGKGHIPPKKRRNKNSIYIATIEKGLALIRSLIELGRLHEIGLIVVDELHLIGEKGRGGTLEMLLTTVIFSNPNIQIVGMSATIGNLPELAKFLHADVFEREFRPVDLIEYVKLGDMIYKIESKDGLEIVPHRKLSYDYSESARRLDPDRLGGLVGEVAPRSSCLVFCPTKRNCENVAALLYQLSTQEMCGHRASERAALAAALAEEGGAELARCVRRGVAFHHAGLASDERALLEHAFRSGVVSVLCCTSTLAAGVNLPAARVVIRAPRVGREFLSLAHYRQMTGRAGRAGLCSDAGESIIICDGGEWERLRAVLGGGLAPACSQLAAGAAPLLLSAAGLRLAPTRAHQRRLLAATLLAVTRTPEEMNALCDETLHSLLKSEALELRRPGGGIKPLEKSETSPQDYNVYDDTELVVTDLGNAAIKGCMDFATAKQVLKDLDVASKSLVLMGSLHLLYLVTPHDGAGVKPDYRHYYSLYCNLDEEAIQTAKILGITEMNAIRMMTGKPITKVPELVLRRFYLALMLHDLWKQVPLPAVAHKFGVPRGTLQAVVSSSSSQAAAAHKLCEQLQRWQFAALLAELAPRLQHCAHPDLRLLMELPAVKKARALQLWRGGFRRVQDVAGAAPARLAAALPRLSLAAARHLVSAARMMLIEKVENLRAEAEDVMEELNVNN